MASILICDDEPDILLGMKFMLRDDFHVVTANSGNEGIRLLEKENFDIIVCDYLMPDGSGEKVLSFIKSNPEKTPSQFYYFSAHADLIVYADPLVKVVPKPDLSSLISAVRSFLQS